MKIWQYAMMAFAALFLGLFFYFGFTTQQCDMDNIYLYCRMKPFTIWDGLGIIIFVGGVLAISQIYYLFRSNDDDEQPGKSMVVYGLLAAILGIILIWNA